MLDVARSADVIYAQLRIAEDNPASQHVAAATGFQVTSEPPVERRRKGQVLRLRTWRQALRGWVPREQRWRMHLCQQPFR